MPKPLKGIGFGARPLRSIRARLLALALVPILVVLPIFLGSVVFNWSARFDRLLIAKVNGELTIAHQYFATILAGNGDSLQAIGESAAFDRLTTGGSPSDLAAFLATTRQKNGWDFLYLLQENGEISSAPKVTAPADLTKWPVVQRALSGEASNEIDIFEANDLSAFSKALVAQARIKLVATKAAAPSQRTAETRGMVIHLARPVQYKGGSAALVAGILLNQNLPFIDTINDLVYPSASLTEGSQGTATLFLDDVRVSTNVRLFENVRALGTRVSEIVRNTVLGKGETWLDRAFVVNDWYISAYEPIIDSYGSRVGMLYVGFLDTPFQAAKLRTFYKIIIGFLLIILASLPVFLHWVRGIITPLETMVATIAKVDDGDLSARSAIVTGQDEILQVAGHLDDLLGQLQERDQKLRSWADELNVRVAQRTRELSDANQRLEATTQQLIVSEKLAAIGEITAGVAHEINNPMAVIQGNLDVIQQEMDTNATDLKTEFNLIYEQIHSVNILVTKLLQFARPEEFVGIVDFHSPNDVINDSLPLVQHLLSKVAIHLDCKLDDVSSVAMNRTELQQVVVNLIVNAIHAMPNGGKLHLQTSNKRRDKTNGVEIVISDTGIGMTKKVLQSVFDPFFTTKQSEGTGLGLSISQKLVSRSGGDITADSKVNIGTTFTVWIPSAELELPNVSSA